MYNKELITNEVLNYIINYSSVYIGQDFMEDDNLVQAIEKCPDIEIPAVDIIDGVMDYHDHTLTVDYFDDKSRDLVGERVSEIVDLFTRNQIEVGSDDLVEIITSIFVFTDNMKTIQDYDPNISDDLADEIEARTSECVDYSPCLYLSGSSLRLVLE